eukprot:m.376509 g.376509  ORF g.376509 m.376509 type:complete len:64 (+) comp83568_c0_seq1:47-238(+)
MLELTSELTRRRSSVTVPQRCIRQVPQCLSAHSTGAPFSLRTRTNPHLHLRDFVCIGFCSKPE